MMQVAFVLMGVGGALVYAYVGYVSVQVILLNEQFPGILRVAVPLLELGLFLALSATAWDRFRAGRRAKTSVERAEP